MIIGSFWQLWGRQRGLGEQLISGIDRVRQVGPGIGAGETHVQIGPGFSITVAFFCSILSFKATKGNRRKT